jgi:hypothetical protein
MFNKYKFTFSKSSYKEISNLVEIPDLKLKNQTKMNFIINNLKLGNSFFVDRIILVKLDNKLELVSGVYNLSLIKEYLKNIFHENVLNTKLELVLIELNSKEEYLELKKVI